MTIKDIKQDLKTSTNPVAKSIHHGNGYKVLMMGFNKGMILTEHEAHSPSKLTVLEGSVLYKEEHRIVKLMQYDEVDIPIDITHSVEALEHSLCMLTQGE